MSFRHLSFIVMCKINPLRSDIIVVFGKLTFLKVKVAFKGLISASKKAAII